MIDFLKKQWFVVLIAITLFCFLGYVAIDTANSKVKGKSVDGLDVVASIDDFNLTADDLYNTMYDANAETLLKNKFAYAVANEAVETTSDIKDVAKEATDNFIQSQLASGNTTKSKVEETYEKQLKGLGFDGTLEDYFIVTEKQKQIVAEYMEEHKSDLVDPFVEEQQPRMLSHILIKMADPANPTEEEQAKVKAVEDALAAGTSFADVAKEFSEDAGSKEDGGNLGYSDATNSRGWVQAFQDAAQALSSGETSEWVKVTSDNYNGWHLILVDSTDIETILADKDARDNLYNSIMAKDDKLSDKITWERAEKIGITFANDDVEALLRKAYSAEEE